jgi:hypothetical protein
MSNDAQLRDVRATLTTYLDEVLSLRFGYQPPKPGQPLSTHLDTLLDVRQRLDRIEELLVRAVQVRGVARRKAEHATAVADDAFDKAIHNARLGAAGEFTSAKERTAEANLDSLDTRREARSANLLAEYCDQHVELLKLTHRGLDSARHDLLTTMRVFHVESALER